ncbi:peptidyl-prolyl cis-trans isomerase CWC27 [Biomphalaria glabrata]|uniref:Spliceosome-associated protein CWC27 homolog n=1 Tax=Biomphalaria glabrata TaxID=6526 RepID=A0A2C9JHZ4_BIOGL|nr:putative peptidyl-prolyl cis-trans isomerase CWC27 [Biomphalaria glabrata]
MSNIYIQEPPTKGKVLLVTSVGEIDIELWSKETPKACRNFVQLCMEGYYNGTIFHRVVKDFIVQGGDPTGTGTDGESIYGAPFKDEFHSRLRFVRRGLVAMANSGPNDNGSQFFFTMNQTPELQNKHTIFGKVTGPTLFNMLKLQDVEVDDTERPTFPPTIIRTEILSNPFDDIVPRMIKRNKKEKEEDKKVKSQSKATKNFSLLSFGEEAEEDEEQTYKVVKKFSGKSKSSHDLTDDPLLSSVPVVDSEKTSSKRKSQEDGVPVESTGTEEVRKKLKKDPSEAAQVKETVESPNTDDKRKIRNEEIKKEALRLQREIKASKKRAETKSKEVKTEKDDEKSHKPEEKDKAPDFLESFKMERQRFKEQKKMLKKPGQSREEQTLALLEKFQSKLSSVKQLSVGYSDSEGEDDKETKKMSDFPEDDAGDLSWMRHKLQFDDGGGKKVLDANVADADRYEIHDPRNPLTQRRREASKNKTKKK